MTELWDVWQGVLIIFIGTVGGIVLIFFGGTLWDNIWQNEDNLGLFDAPEIVSTSWHDSPGIALGFGNMFYTAGILGIILSWAMGVLTVYRKQRYDEYVRQY